MDSRQKTSSKRKLTFLRQESTSRSFYAGKGKLPEETVPTGGESDPGGRRAEGARLIIGVIPVILVLDCYINLPHLRGW